MSEEPKEGITPLEERIGQVEKQISLIPSLIAESFKEYDRQVQERAKIVTPSNPSSSSGLGSSFFADLVGLFKNITGTASGQSAEINDLANKIVLMALRNTLRNVDKAMGGSGHVTIEGK